jgi:hypothetical protein
LQDLERITFVFFAFSLLIQNSKNESFMIEMTQASADKIPIFATERKTHA